MRNVLIFRSTKHPIVKECIKKINSESHECNIWLCVQKQCKDLYTEYDNIQFIVFPNGMFSLNGTLSDCDLFNKLEKLEIDTVFIPCTSISSDFTEIEKIIRVILHKKKVCYFDFEGKIYNKRIRNKLFDFTKIIENIYEFIDFHIMILIYLMIIRRNRNDRR